MHGKVRFLGVSAVLLACLHLWITVPCGAQSMKGMKPKSAAPKEDKLPGDLKPDQVDGYLAGLSDEQARKVLKAELRKDAEARASKGEKALVGTRDRGITAGFFEARGALSELFGRVGGVLEGAHLSPETDVWEKVVGGKGPGAAGISLGLLFLLLAAGGIVERLVTRRAKGLWLRSAKGGPGSLREKAAAIVTTTVVDLVGIGVYGLVTFVGCLLVQGEAGTLVPAVVVVSYYVRLVELAARIITAPNRPDLRLALMEDADARLLYRWIVLLTACVVPGSALVLALEKAGAPRDLFLLVYSTAGPVMSLFLTVMIWRVRRRLGEVIHAPGAGEAEAPPGAGAFRKTLAAVWHVPAIVFVLAVGGYWWMRVLTRADVTIVRLVFSLFLVPVCIMADQWVHRILVRSWRMRREVIDLSPGEGPIVDAEEEDSDEEEERGFGPVPRKPPGKDISIYFPLIRKAFRVVIGIFLFFGALGLWGIDFNLGWIFARSVLGTLIALGLGLIVWEVVKARIDQRIAEEIPFQGDMKEEGGSGGSRSGTLLLLLRKFILVFLTVVVGFSILASLGVNIAPLLAGAGVVGLAIGFGSQTLVKDIIAGIFFLVDDAFRVGDYVEAGMAKGTVEHISLRSVRLRHPRGQIFVVPFGDLKMIQNFTRDYIIEKLDVRVRFDTDPDVIRKIVKRINKDIMADPEMARVLLSDIKSVGVRAMDDSAMIMRVKFRCLPGEQFILRREVFHRIQKAFKDKGIEFAHRNVTVYLPPQPTTPNGTPGAGAPAEGAGSASPASGGTGAPAPGGASPQSAVQNIPLEAIGAAAAAALAQAEEEALAKQAPKKKG